MRPFPDRPLVWPLFPVALLSYVALGGAVECARSTLDPPSFVYRFCALLGSTPAVWVLLGLLLAVDLLLAYWMRRRLIRSGEAARPVELFFLWQVTKLSFCLVFPALVYAYRPL